MKKSSSAIGLQNHDSKSAVKFRNIRISEPDRLDDVK